MSQSELTGVEAAAASTMEIRLKVALNEQDWDTIMERVRAAMAARQAMGREKYRMTLSENQAPLRERVRHLWEEMLDGLAYSHWIWEAVSVMTVHGEESREDEDASMAAQQCMVRIIASLVDIDRVMRGLGMDPVAEKTAGKDHLADAAPDLLEALKKCARIIGSPADSPDALWRTDAEVNDAYNSAHAAIAKAEGKS